jgi:hypothetical protein
MRPLHLLFLAVVGVAAAGAVIGDLRTDIFWQGQVLFGYAFATAILVIIVGACCRVPSTWYSRSLGPYLAALAAIWLLPLSPTERFVHAAQQLGPGMSASAVDAVMLHQAKGWLAPGDRQRRPLYHGMSYFEPQHQHHSFDTYCLVSWQNGVVTDVSVRLD